MQRDRNVIDEDIQFRSAVEPSPRFSCEDSLQALQEREDCYRSLVLATSQVVWSTDAEGNVTAPLPLWSAYTGQTDAETQGQGWLVAVHADDRDRVAAAWQQALTTKQPYEVEYRLRRADGVYRTVVARGVPIVRSDGSLREWIGTCTDITERQQTETNLREALLILGEHQQQLRTLQRLTDSLNQRLMNLPNLLQTIVNAIHEAVPAADFSLIALKNTVTGLLELAAVAGEQTDRLQPVQAFAPQEGLLGEAFDSDEPRCLPYTGSSVQQDTYLAPLTQTALASVCTVAIHSAQAGKLGVLAIGNWETAHAFGLDNVQLLMAFSEQAAIALTNAKLIKDLEEREELLATQNRILASQNQQLEQQQRHIQQQNLKLREAAQLKSKFLATMSHELRTPMNAIIGFSQILLRQNQLNSTHQSMVERILKNGKQLLSLVNEILDLSKMESGQVDLTLEVIDLPHLVHDAVEELRSPATEKHLALHVAIDLPNPTIINDGIRLRQILMNLLSNAIKFTEMGYVAVRVEEVGPGADYDTNSSRILLTVKDSGIGIAESNLSQIFEEFHQVDQSLAKRFYGTGMGLAATNLLVKMMGGIITVESQLNQGSTFRVEIPRRVELPQAHTGFAARPQAQS